MTLDLEMEEILLVFLEESREGLDAMEAGLLSLSAKSAPDVIDTIFRAAHSIKGGAGTFGYSEISEFTHGVETLLDEMRTGARAVSPEAVSLLLRSVDVIRGMIACVQHKQPIAVAETEFVKRDIGTLLGASDSTGEPTVTPSNEAVGWRVHFTPAAELFRTVNDPLRLFRELATVGEITVTAQVDRLPDLDSFDPMLCYMAWTVIVHAPAERDQILEVFDWVSSVAEVVCQPLDASLRVLGEEPADCGTAPTVVEQPQIIRGKVAADNGSIRVSIEKLDALINLVGELVITQSMLGSFGESYDQGALQSLRRGLTQLARNTRELQENVMQMRMLPISFSFNRFPRLVHDLSRKLQKTVELRLSGEGTELDKTVLEKISDPLVHLVRNALDHGIEMPAARRASGKRECGTISLNAFHQGGNIIIEVKDDGAGLNKDRILAKARERGLVKRDEELSESQIYNLIFLPGFSTAETVSDVSGRGVGMDVVRRNIIDLGGHVQISSELGIGSTIRIRLPLTLAILEGQMLRVGEEIYVVSLISIVETVQPAKANLSTVPGAGELYRHRDTFIPVIRLNEMLNIPSDSKAVSDGLLVVVEADGQRAAILVDELLAQQQVVIKSLETHFKQIPCLAGATIHGDGSVALILDVPGLIAYFMARNSLPRSFAA